MATARDLPALVELINAAYRVEAFFIRGQRLSLEEAQALLAAPSAAFLVLDAEDGSTPAGTVYAETRDGRGHFALLAVSPAHQGRGLGRQLIAAVEAYCRSAGCRALDLEVFDVRRELHPFYASCGFAVTGARPFSKPDLLLAPATLIVMSKPLAGREDARSVG